MSTDLSEFTVTKMHPVVHASYAMTVNEQRILLACICQIDPRYAMPDGKTYILTIEQAKDLFYTDKDARNIYKDLSRAVEKLYERDVKVALPNGDTLQTRFVQSIVWSPDNLQIQVKFADDIKPYLSELKNNFSSYKLKNIVQLTSIYAVRLYEWLVSWASQNQSYKELTLDELREKLDLGTKYQGITLLKERVINVAITQINENTDLQVDVSYKKFKREIRSVQFTFQQKPEIAAIENQRKAERKAIADQNRAAKIRREYAEQQAAEHQKAINEKLAREQAEQERQAQEKAEREQKKAQLIEIWESLSETERHEVQNHAVKMTYPAFQNSLTVAFETNNLKELTGRFLNDFANALEPFQFQKPKMEQPIENHENIAETAEKKGGGLTEKSLAEKLTQMWKAGLLSQEEFLNLISNT